MTNRILSKLSNDYIYILHRTKICYPCFCTRFASSKNDLHQVRIETYTQKLERTPVASEGTGWAGQPIVKRAHAILPEVCGDVSDVFTALNQLPDSQLIENNQENAPTQQSKISNLMHVQSSDSNNFECSERLNQSSDSELDKSHDQNVSQSCIECHNNISLMNSYDSDKLTANAEITSKAMKEQETNFVEQSINKGGSDYLDLYKADLKANIVMKRSKPKMKKRTKVLGVKTLRGVHKGKMVRKKKTKVYALRKYKPQSQIVLCQRNKSHYINTGNVLLAENRHLMTDSALNYQKTSMVLNKNKVKISKKPIKVKKPTASDDCVCPEIKEDKQKETTKICGEAGEGEEKEKKKRKQKMCTIEPIMKYRQKTYVCAPAVIKGKRKRQLPKCPEPEKKVAPRTEVCPPQLLEAKATAEQCVKQVEVKIRKRTKVCRPVVIYAKEEASIKIEKTVCAESRIKQTISKHTKVCPPITNKMEKSKINRK